MNIGDALIDPVTGASLGADEKQLREIMQKPEIAGAFRTKFGFTSNPDTTARRATLLAGQLEDRPLVGDDVDLAVVVLAERRHLRRIDAVILEHRHYVTPHLNELKLEVGIVGAPRVRRVMPEGDAAGAALPQRTPQPAALRRSVLEAGLGDRVDLR